MVENKSLFKGKKYTVGLGITSWKSYESLEKALTSYKKVGLLSLFDKSLIWFQDIGDKERNIAKKYGVDCAGGKNSGIAEGMRNLAKNLGTDYVLFLENDCPVVEDIKEIKKQLLNAVELLESGKIDIMRLRHRWQFGECFSIEKYFRYFPGYKKDSDFIHKERMDKTVGFVKFLRRLFRPFKARKLIGYGLYFEKEPEKIFPKYIQKDKSGVFIVDSSVMTWTNQSVLCKKDFFLNTILAYVDTHPCRRTSNGFQSPERALNNKWWKHKHFKIGVGRGLFTHCRFDDSWRKGHQAFNPNKGS